MPSGIYNRKKSTYRCKKCSGKTFNTISEMRKHQWSAHPESYANLSRKTAELNPTNVLTVRQVLTAAQVNGTREMTVPQLLNELTSHHKFMGDMIAFITNTMRVYQGGTHE